MTDSRYRTIVADPPWDVKRIEPGNRWGNPALKVGLSTLPYQTMTLDEIKALPVGDLAERDAHLYIWTINSYVEPTYDIARAWGFTPSTLLTWAKPPKGIGPGGAYSITSEHILFCRRGSLPAKQRVDSTWWSWPRGVHSAKPEAFIDMVETVGPGPYAELFARRARFGWDYPIGDQALGGVAA